MIAKVIVDIPSKSVDFTFDYVIPKRLAAFVQVGVRVVVPFGPRTVQGYVMDIQSHPDQDIDETNLKNQRSTRYSTRINFGINTIKCMDE